MKRLMILLAILLALCIPACAEQQAEEAALQVMLNAHPGYAVLACDQWSPTAAAVLGKGEERILCVAEKKDGAWALTIDNARALPQGAEVSILVDTDTALYWSIHGEVAGIETAWQYSCFRGEAQWGAVDCIRMAVGENDLIETSLYWESDTVKQVTEYRDVNENFIRREETAAIPAKWMGEYRTLQTYDASAAPVPLINYKPDSWLGRDTLRRCLEEIAPGYTFVSGAATDDGLEIMARDREGTLRMVACLCMDGMTITNISSPLPEGTHYGWENFWDCVTINNHAAAAVRPYANGVWGVDYTWPMGQDGEALFFGRNWVSDSNVLSRGMFYVGDNPWNDVTTADWSTLPATMEEAKEHIDPSRWAVVNNPNPADRLHLRERDDRASRSLGKYYNGTPVEVLRTAGDWAFVRAGGMTGWMMKEYLAFGEDAWAVKAAFPDLHHVEDKDYFLVWREDNLHAGKMAADGDWSVETGESWCIIGLLGDEYYHVWFPDLDESGYMLQSDFWPGNG